MKTSHIWSVQLACTQGAWRERGRAEKALIWWKVLVANEENSGWVSSQMVSETLRQCVYAVILGVHPHFFRCTEIYISARSWFKIKNTLSPDPFLNSSLSMYFRIPFKVFTVTWKVEMRVKISQYLSNAIECWPPG